MPITLENVGIAVRDLDSAVAFFTDLGLALVGRDEVSGEWTDTAVGLDGNHARIAMLQTPDGQHPELFEYIHPEAIESEPTRPNVIGMQREPASATVLREPAYRSGRHEALALVGTPRARPARRRDYQTSTSSIRRDSRIS